MYSKNNFSTLVQKSYYTILFIAILGSACVVQVHSKYDKKAPSQEYLTYKVHLPSADQEGISEAVYVPPLAIKQVMKSINNEMQFRQYKPTEENADLSVHLYFRVNDKVVMDSVFQYHGIAYMYGKYLGYDLSFAQNLAPLGYPVGTLFIDVVDNRQNKLIWYSIGETTVLMDSYDGNEIERIVSDLFFRYPFVAGVTGKVNLAKQVKRRQ